MSSSNEAKQSSIQPPTSTPPPAVSKPLGSALRTSTRMDESDKGSVEMKSTDKTERSIMFKEGTKTESTLNANQNPNDIRNLRRLSAGMGTSFGERGVLMHAPWYYSFLPNILRNNLLKDIKILHDKGDVEEITEASTKVSSFVKWSCIVVDGFCWPPFMKF